MSKGHSGAYQPGTAFRAGAIPVLPTATVSGGGTMMGNLSSILNDYRITNHYYPNGTWQQIVGAVRPGSPVIAHVNVGARGYGHFVVLHAFHPSAPKGLIILDPEYGLVADAAGNSFTNNRNDVATFSGHYITT